MTKKNKATKAPKVEGDAFERMSEKDAPLVKVGGSGRQHRYASVIEAVPSLKPGDCLRVKLLEGDDLHAAVVSISQGIRRRGLRELPNGARIRVRSGEDGSPYVCCNK